MNLFSKKKKHSIVYFSTKNSEGFFKKCIRSHLVNDDKKCWELIRLNHELLYFVLSLIYEEITETNNSSTRVNITKRRTSSYLRVNFDVFLYLYRDVKFT